MTHPAIKAAAQELGRRYDPRSDADLTINDIKATVLMALRHQMLHVWNNKNDPTRDCLRQFITEIKESK